MLRDDKTVDAFKNLPQSVDFKSKLAPLAVINNLLMLVQGKYLEKEGSLEIAYVRLIQFLVAVKGEIGGRFDFDLSLKDCLAYLALVSLASLHSSPETGESLSDLVNWAENTAKPSLLSLDPTQHQDESRSQAHKDWP